MEYSESELLCEVMLLYKRLRDMDRLDPEEIKKNRKRFRDLRDYVLATGTQNITSLLPLVEVRLEQLEALVELMNFLPSIKALKIPHTDLTKAWSMSGLQKYIDFTKEQHALLLSVPTTLVPENDLYYLRQQEAVVLSNTLKLKQLFADISRDRNEALYEGEEMKISGGTFLKLLQAARRKSMVQWSDDQTDLKDPRGVLATIQFSLHLVTAETEGRYRNTLQINDQSRSGFTENEVNSVVQAVYGPDLLEEKNPEPNLRTSLQTYADPFFTEELSWETCRFYSAVLLMLMNFTQRNLELYALVETKVKARNDNEQMQIFAHIGVGGLGFLASSLLMPGVLASASLGLALGAQTVAAEKFYYSTLLPYLGPRVRRFAETVLNKFYRREAAKAEEKEPKEFALDDSRVQKARTLDEAVLKSIEIGKEQENVTPHDLPLNATNAFKMAYGWLFLPRELMTFMLALKKYVETPNMKPPFAELAELFVPFYSFMPRVYEIAAYPKWTIFDRVKPPRPELANVTLIRHWHAKSLDHAVEHLKLCGFAHEADARESSHYGFALKLAALNSDYGFLRHIDTMLKMTSATTQPVVPEDLDVLLLETLRSEGRVDPKLHPQLWIEFENAKEALLSYRSWASLHEQELSPVDYLRVRGLDLASVRELRHTARGVRVLLPLVVKKDYDVFELAERVLNPHLVAVLKKSEAFVRIWTELLDRYAEGNDTREEFLKEFDESEVSADLLWE